jgi:long-chain acyl-CoA synthetase
MNHNLDLDKITRIFDLLPHYRDSFDPKDDVLAGKDDGEWKKYDIHQHIEISDNISYGLMALGIEKGDKVGTIMSNRPEWNFLDMGIMQIGAVHTPIYPTISESDYKYILNHSEVKCLFIEGKELLSKIEHILPEIKGVKNIFTVKQQDGLKNLKDLLELGESNIDEDKLQARRDAVDRYDLATLIYTSGTTGNQKGVMLSHNNIVSNFKALEPILPIDQKTKALSYLPLCHVYERILIYLYMTCGVSIYYAESVAKIIDNLQEVKPDMFVSIPRFLEKVFDRIMDKGQKLPFVKKMIFFWAVKTGMKYKVDGSNGPFYNFALSIARKLVFNKWKEAMGNNVKYIVSGGAALQGRLAKIYTAAGIRILQGYGLTESSPVIAVSTLEKNGVKFGTVGPVLPNIELKIADDGEILAKGPSIMMGYYKDPDLTKETIDEEGFLHTGDAGRLEEHNHLRITGRKKLIFKTSLGKYVNPQFVEDKFKESPFIDNILVMGENKKFAAALLVPDFIHLKEWCKKKDIEYTSDAEMIKLPRIKKRFHKEVTKCNSHLGSAERIMKYQIMDKEWTIQDGELTASLKMRRSFICEKYADLIESLFV